MKKNVIAEPILSVLIQDDHMYARNDDVLRANMTLLVVWISKSKLTDFSPGSKVHKVLISRSNKQRTAAVSIV